MAIIYQQLTEDANMFNSSNVTTGGGLTMTGSNTAIGHTCKSVTFKIKKIGSPTTVTVSAQIVECASPTNVKVQYSSMSSDSITTDFEEYTFTNASTTYTIGSGDLCCLTFTAGAAHPNVFTQSGKAGSTSDEKFGDFKSGVSEGCTGGQIPYIIMKSTIPTPPSTGTRLPPPPLIVRF